MTRVQILIILVSLFLVIVSSSTSDQTTREQVLKSSGISYHNGDTISPQLEERKESSQTDSRWSSKSDAVSSNVWTPGNWTQENLTAELDDWSFLNNWTLPQSGNDTNAQLMSQGPQQSSVSSYSNDGRNQKMYEPNKGFQLVQISPLVNKPKQVSEFSTIRPNVSNVLSDVPIKSNSSNLNHPIMTATSSSSSTSPQSTSLIGNSLITPLINVGPQSSNSLLNPLRIFSPLRNLILMSFEGYRHLMTDARKIEDFIRVSLGMSKRAHFRSLDPLDLPDPLVVEHRDKKIPILGKVVLTLSDIAISGLSQFKVEQLDGLGRNLYFQHLIPRLDSIANYTIDYHLFDAIPFRVSAGKITANVPNARVRGSFQVFPDILNIWFRVAQLNLTTMVDDLNIRFYPEYLISERFAIEKSTIEKIHTAFNYLLPNVTDILRLTYTKAIEMRLGQ